MDEIHTFEEFGFETPSYDLDRGEFNPDDFEGDYWEDNDPLDRWKEQNTLYYDDDDYEKSKEHKKKNVQRVRLDSVVTAKDLMTGKVWRFSRDDEKGFGNIVGVEEGDVGILDGIPIRITKIGKKH